MAPYAFNQRLPFDIDYKVIGTFREFYVALLRFINYKLFSDLGMAYPPKIQGLNDEECLFLDSKQVRETQEVASKKLQAQYEASVAQIGVSEEFKETPEIKELTKKHEQLKRQRRLFGKCVFLLGRETPIYYLQDLILSFGGQFYTSKDDVPEGVTVTHVVMDRPLPSNQKGLEAEYVQP